jgi:hypothetical protein
MSTRVELKVCEGCGALWLRKMGDGAQGSQEKRGGYCRACSLMLSEFPVPRRPRKRKKRVSCVGGAR